MHSLSRLMVLQVCGDVYHAELGKGSCAPLVVGQRALPLGLRVQNIAVLQPRNQHLLPFVVSWMRWHSRMHNADHLSSLNCNGTPAMHNAD